MLRDRKPHPFAFAAEPRVPLMGPDRLARTQAVADAMTCVADLPHYSSPSGFRISMILRGQVKCIFLGLQAFLIR